MALNFNPESSTGILGAINGSLGLFSDQNKAGGINDEANPQPIDPFESKMTDLEIIELKTQWIRTYNVYYTPIEQSQKLAFDYWIGKHRNPDNSGFSNISALGQNVGVTDNLIFEAIETFLPIATRANPDPLVQADPSEVGQRLAHDIKVALVHEADVQQLRRKLAKMTRSWLLNRLGVVKVTWDPQTAKIVTEVISAKRLVMDKDGYVNEKGMFVGEYIGEKKKQSAQVLSEMFPKHAAAIKAKAHGKMGTKLDYYEWWYKGTDLFYTIDEIVLGKFKNPNWNWDGEEQVLDPNTQQMVSREVQGVNHLDKPTDPYRFLSIFSTNEQPHDNTGLIIQNIPQQDKINRREVQIDKNVEGMNNGIVVSGTAFTEEQASQAANALRRGVAIRVPNGDVQKAVMFPVKPALPGDVFKSLEDGRNELRNIFGTAGSTPQGTEQQDTVRGKLLVNQMDSSRIGGGITDCIEQVADAVYNLWVQMMFVYYDEDHFISVAGAVDGMELVNLKNADFPLLKTLTVTVKENSMVPKDPMTQRNEAIDLWSANAIDPFSLYKKLDFPDPAEATNQLILWQMLQKGQIQPQMYLPSFAVAGQTPGQPQLGQSLPTEQPGTGGAPVNPLGASQPGGIQPGQPAQTQSQQLLASEPLPKV